jgi:hypothetical protein
MLSVLHERLSREGVNYEEFIAKQDTKAGGSLSFWKLLASIFVHTHEWGILSTLRKF